MKKRLKVLIIIGFIFCTHNFLKSQGGLFGNFSTGFNFLGFTVAGPAQALNVRNDFNRPINFSTNSSIRMIIDGGTGSLGSGQIAMGNSLPAGFAPQARLHLHQTGSIFSTINTYVRFTNSFTGPTSTDGFSIDNQT